MRRRDFLRRSGAGLAASGLSGALAPGTAAALERLAPNVPASGGAPDDEAFWRGVRALYAPPDDVLDLDQANTGPTPLPVFDAYVARARRMSRAPAERFGTMWAEELDARASPALAALLGARKENLAFTSSATTALNTVLRGFPLQRGDEVLVTDHEYPDMVETILQRGRREGIAMRTVRVPAANEDRLALVARVEQAITPRTKLLLVSHVSAWSGEVLPVAEVTAAARARGVAVLVDAAQSVGVLDVHFEAMGCDFLGASLHKWLGAPVASGVLLMRREHVGRVEPLHPVSWDTGAYPIDAYTWSGTFQMPAYASVIEAIEFQRTLGAERKRARLRFLGDHWQDRLRGVPGVRLLTPRDPARSLGVASFAVEGVPSKALASHLRTRHGIGVQDKAGRHSPYGSAVRVAPAVHTTPRELDRLVAAVVEVARRGVPGER